MLFINILVLNNGAFKFNGAENAAVLNKSQRQSSIQEEMQEGNNGTDQHTAEQTTERKPARNPTADAGSGSAEWANWPRAVLSIMPTSELGVYSLTAAKRGKRLGWKLPDGKTQTLERFIKHASQEGQIYWEETEPPIKKFTVKRTKTLNDIMALVPTDKPIAKNSLIAKAQLAGIGEKTAHNLINDALANETLFSHLKPRQGTNHERWISRLRKTPEGFLQPSEAKESKTSETDAGTSKTPLPKCQSPD